MDLQSSVESYGRNGAPFPPFRYAPQGGLAGKGYPCTPFRRGRVFSPSRPPLGERCTRMRGGCEKGAPLRELPLAYARDHNAQPCARSWTFGVRLYHAVCSTLIISRLVWNVKRDFSQSQYLSSGRESGKEGRARTDGVKWRKSRQLTAPAPKRGCAYKIRVFVWFGALQAPRPAAER